LAAGLIDGRRGGEGQGRREKGEEEGGQGGPLVLPVCHAGFFQRTRERKWRRTAGGRPGKGADEGPEGWWTGERAVLRTNGAIGPTKFVLYLCPWKELCRRG
jgi:hypothetical protein